MGRPNFDESPDTGSSGNEDATETNVGVHYNSPPSGQIQYHEG